MANKGGTKKNGAYAGDHLTPSGGRGFRVYYLGRLELAQIKAHTLAAGLRWYPRGHRHATRTGWYWISLVDHVQGKPSDRVGPFTASGAAYRAAVERLDKGKG